MAAITPWKPSRELKTIRERIDDIFDWLTREFFGPGWWDHPHESTKVWAPVIESYIENGNLVVKTDLPGIDPKEVTISAPGIQLTIAGERKREKEKEKEHLYHELPYGKFSRTLVLPDGIDADKIKADYKNGVLEITVPAPKQLVSKKIPIEVQR